MNWVKINDRLPEENTPVLLNKDNFYDIGYLHDECWIDNRSKSHSELESYEFWCELDKPKNFIKEERLIDHFLELCFHFHKEKVKQLFNNGITQDDIIKMKEESENHLKEFANHTLISWKMGYDEDIWKNHLPRGLTIQYDAKYAVNDKWRYYRFSIDMISFKITKWKRYENML